ncbi:MAG: HlyD family efflux transporter periplasmic adaptor subunit [Nevskia sp.]|nr:HlyD family efflux transporter periplasmic adaptor subunit [Nevskia sp.]
MKLPQHPYRKLVYRELQRDGGYCTLIGKAADAPLRLTAAEFELAALFDGARDANAIRAAAPPGVDVERLAQRLSDAGLLDPGRREPLPVPPQYAATHSRRARAPSARGAGALLPSTLPGTLSGPNFIGSITGLYGWDRGEAAALGVALDVRGLQPIGALLNLFLFGRLRVWLLLLLTLSSAIVMYNHRFELGRDFSQLLQPVRGTLLAVVGAYMVDGLAKLARYAAIARCTHTRPRFGITLGGLGLPVPHFYTETAGASEAAERVARMRIVGSALTSLMTMFVLSTLVWMMFHRQGSVLAPLAVGMAFITTVFFIIQVNPLGMRSGYQLLMLALRVGDLREQAGFALFGYELPWSSVRRPPTSVLFLYAGLVVLYFVWVIVFFLNFPADWLKDSWGPLGPVLILSAIAYVVYSMLRRTYDGQFNIGEKVTVSLSKHPLEWVRQTSGKYWREFSGWVKANKPGPITWTLIVVATIICLLPYPYQPSGTFVVLPDTRADVHAQVAGEVRKVFVKEGDLVKAGTMLAQLADEDEKAQLAGAQATLAKLQAALAIGQAGHRPEEIEVARQAVNTAQTAYQYAREEADRLATAYKRKAVSEQDYKHALSIADVSQQKLLEARRQLTLTSSPTRADEIKGLQAELEHQRAQIEYQQTLLGYTQVRAPIDGRIVSGSLQFAVGDFMQRGAMLATVEDSDHPKIEIKIPEDDLSEITVGNKAWAKIWGSPNDAYPGHVSSIAPSAEKAPYGNVVRVYMTVDKPDMYLKPEMTGYAKVDGRWHPVILAFTRPVVRLLFVEIWSWIP